METFQKLNLQFCEKCKLHFFPNIENNSIPSECNICGGILIDTDVSYDEYRTLPKTKRCSKCKRKYPKLFIKCPRCHCQLIKLSTENKQMDKQINEIREQVATQPTTPKCPTCGSTNVKHISTLNRAVSIGMLGIFSGKIGKNYECLDCKSRW